MFAIGVREGSLRGFNQLALALTPNLKGPLFGSAERFNRLRKDVVLDHFNVGAIVAVATSLYEDPANQYISLIDVLFIAQAKLDGEDVENRLRTARAAAAYVLRNP